MKTYLDLLDHVLDHGVAKSDRTGTGTLSVFGYQMRFDLHAGLPAAHHQEGAHPLGRRRAAVVPAGSTNVKWLHEQGVTIWDEWADADGELGPIYGYQWRSWPTPDGGHIDQIGRGDRVDPRPIPTPAATWSAPGTSATWSRWRCRRATPCSSSTCPAPPTARPGRLSCQLYQRSADIFLGVPFNIASYALLTHLVAQVCGSRLGDFVHTLGDAHLYLNHLDQARLQLDPRAAAAAHAPPEPGRHRRSTTSASSDIAVEAYDPHPGIKAPIAV